MRLWKVFPTEGGSAIKITCLMNVSFTLPTIFYFRREPELSWAQERADRERHRRKMTQLLEPVLVSKLHHIATCKRYDHSECNLFFENRK